MMAAETIDLLAAAFHIRINRDILFCLNSYTFLRHEQRQTRKPNIRGLHGLKHALLLVKEAINRSGAVETSVL